MDDRTEILPGPPPCEVTHRYATVNGVRLHYVEALPARNVNGTARVVCALHGFPELWYSWRHQLPALAEAGFRAVACDLRGYNESDKPAGVRSYRMDLLVQDVVGLIGQVGGRAVVVGHDWGGVLAWHLAMRAPELVEALVVLNAPHPLAFRREMGNPVQWVKSSYAFFFQLPWLPELVLRAFDFALLERALRRQPVHE